MIHAVGVAPLPDRFPVRSRVIFANFVNWICQELELRCAGSVRQEWDVNLRSTLRLFKRASGVGDRCSANGLGGWSVDLFNDMMSGRTGMRGLRAAASVLNLVHADALRPGNPSGTRDEEDIDRLLILLMAAPQILFGGIGRKASRRRVERICNKRWRAFKEGKWTGWLQHYQHKPRTGPTNNSRDQGKDRCLRYVTEGAHLSRAF